MTEPNGMTYMTDEERKILGTLKQHPTNILTLSHCPSEEFLWQDILCNSRTDEIKDLLQFGKEIKVFLQIL